MDDLHGAAAGTEPVSARFDAPGGPGAARSFRFRGLLTVLRADTLADVVPVLAAVQRAARDGLHAAGYVAYEAAPAFDPALATRPPDPRLPLAWFAIFQTREEVAPSFEDGAAAELGAWRMRIGEAEYRGRIEQIRALIAAGDSYQVNFTTRLGATFRGDADALYARLCLAQCSGYCAHLRLGPVSILSASPELFFRASGGELELRPMKGTRPRGRFPAEDAALAAELAASAKDRAENLMIVDLLRNDAGRVSEFGSVRVERMFAAERYETVHQLTSTIRSRLRPDVGLVEIFRALFPCGSVTGAPKVRTMEIIAGAEDEPRGVYCGAIGFVSPNEAVFSVAIRTLLLDHGAGTAELGVGSGVTYDSDAGAEYQECLDKAEFTRRMPVRFDLLETLLWEPDCGWLLLDGHLDRIAASAAYFGYAFDRAAVAGALQSAAGGFGDERMRVRLTIDRSGHPSITATPLAPLPEPVRVAISADPVDHRDPMLFHKTTHRAAYECRAAARPDADDVLLINERGEVTESTIANLVARIGGVLWTPPLDCGVLPGVLRAELLRTGEIRERVLHPADLRAADELWLINSVRRWRKAILID
ncbi:aminodeoxychorismate synthase component I [Longimicrobium terrae]|uniref:Para-aminobenzoate synthetase/4-amino-4-deoxychorismate lyase n=1 Tax=Longimicrobium terrae TaxID=1639882 RepID=A0A841H244_9BACT|nr:para-aminobenzoate synthetase/4-amino-4-deoxychorismate lyase [Longimicrobium terrae]MBB6072097.1 para-aminobenzoate synthetase/4-amino-4-deoxychorismate lyase [Longimicrobium terrae]NNC29820.1 aminodeoxychorismate synthase component I [Longimicrobium terrae]